ncbi:MAG: hypothetical protein A2Y17_12200 [Clostridiales bacterium GWF2_38_85]|nr:MAG: hypothetical protein A2Y17_12200 [Clostridiales bacterium GWF2_38_85]
MNTDIMSKAEAIKILEDIQKELIKLISIPMGRKNGKTSYIYDVVKRIGALEIAINELRRNPGNDTL